jgi:uncharacterized membrane protein YciS (DUF1049 family)
MKIIKWGFVVVVTIAVTCILLFTFMQEPFRTPVPAIIFWHHTQEFPVYVFVAATFGIGLFIGFLIAAYYYIAGQAGISSKKKEIRRLEDIVTEMTGELAVLRNTAEQARKKTTESLKAVGEKDFIA